MSRTLLSLCVVALVAVVFSFVGPTSNCPAADLSAEAPFAEPADEQPSDAVCCRPPAEPRAKRKRCCAPVMIEGIRTAARAERKILRALRSPTELEFIETPLRDVVDFLKDFHKIEIQIDTKALDDVGLSSGEQITKNLKGIPLQSALRLMLRDLDLTYVIQDCVLLITTPEEAECRLTTMLYPVAELLGAVDQQGSFPADGKTLIEVIVSTVQPTTWEEVGGPGSIGGVSFGGVDSLIISQTNLVHEEVAGLLKQLCRVAKVTDRSNAVD